MNLGWNAYCQKPEIWEAEYNKFINELSVFVSKELSEFRCSIVSLGESTTLFVEGWNTAGHFMYWVSI